MITHPRCPACDDDAWSRIGEARFSRGAVDRTPYERLRDRVLFELWVSDADVVTLAFAMCEGCGFVTFLPRPSGADVDTKYALIAAHERRPPRDEALDVRRSQQMLRWVRSQVAGRCTLLDLGGGRGELLSAFVDAGFACSVVDYPEVPVPGVERVAATLADAAPGRTFSIVLASHVFEHFADPSAVATQLWSRVEPSGLLFVEVPLELLGGPPKMREPVTHVSFFCEASLSVLLQRAGFEIVHVQTLSSLFASGAHRYSVRVCARRLDGVPEPARVRRPGAAEARRLLGAGQWAKAVRALTTARDA